MFGYAGYMAAPNATSHGGISDSTQQASNAAAILYSPADQANAEIDIVGDPDWIAQSELFYGPNKERNQLPHMPDGSVNTDLAEVFFSINFNTVVDYDLETGLADTTQKNVTTLHNKSEVAQYKLVYRANTITTQLVGGQFLQKLMGTIIYVPTRCLTSRNESVRENGSQQTVESDNGDQSSDDPFGGVGTAGTISDIGTLASEIGSSNNETDITPAEAKKRATPVSRYDTRSGSGFAQTNEDANG
jgi:hypothetical protein